MKLKIKFARERTGKGLVTSNKPEFLRQEYYEILCDHSENHDILFISDYHIYVEFEIDEQSLLLVSMSHPKIMKWIDEFKVYDTKIDGRTLRTSTAHGKFIYQHDGAGWRQYRGFQ